MRVFFTHETNQISPSIARCLRYFKLVFINENNHRKVNVCSNSKIPKDLSPRTYRTDRISNKPGAAPITTLSSTDRPQSGKWRTWRACVPTRRTRVRYRGQLTDHLLAHMPTCGACVATVGANLVGAPSHCWWEGGSCVATVVANLGGGYITLLVRGRGRVSLQSGQT